MRPITLRLAFDGGWTDGDPGDGRVRFNGPHLARATYIYLNARDSQDALLDELIPTWGVGDVLVIERAGLTLNRVVAWVVGPIRHGGSYYKIPVHVRSVHGAFAAHDNLTLHRSASEAGPLMAGQVEKELTPVAPLAPATQIPPENRDLAAVADSDDELTPIAPIVASANQDMEALRRENEALQSIIEHLVTDTTPLLAVEEER
jgi:hypothetical protein